MKLLEANKHITNTLSNVKENTCDPYDDISNEPSTKTQVSLSEKAHKSRDHIYEDIDDTSFSSSQQGSFELS